MTLTVVDGGRHRGVVVAGGCPSAAAEEAARPGHRFNMIATIVDGTGLLI